MLKRPCDQCRSTDRDPSRTKTCRKGHYLCSSCHGGWRKTCPLCEAALEATASPSKAASWNFILAVPPLPREA